MLSFNTNPHSKLSSNLFKGIASLPKACALVCAILVMFAGTQASYAVASKTTASVKQTEQNIPVLSVNINKASAEELAEVLTGVGLKKAKLIIEYREKHGAFKKVEDLLAVKGIGERTLEKNRQKVKLQ